MSLQEEDKRMLFMTEEFEPFESEWGSWSVCIPYNGGFICPLGWEEELSLRGIIFEEIIIPNTDEL